MMFIVLWQYRKINKNLYMQNYFSIHKTISESKKKMKKIKLISQAFHPLGTFGPSSLTINFVCMRSRRVITKTDGIKEIYKCINSGLIKGREREKGNEVN